MACMALEALLPIILRPNIFIGSLFETSNLINPCVLRLAMALGMQL
jgi:hypothetical protein